MIDDIWQWECISQTLPRERMTRVEALRTAASGSCVCEGEWSAAVVGSFLANSIPVQALCKDVLHLLTGSSNFNRHGIAKQCDR